MQSGDSDRHRSHLVMNRIFFGLIAIAFTWTAWRQLGVGPQDLGGAAEGVATAPMDALTTSIFDGARKSVDLAFKFVGGMTLFLGLMKIVEVGGGLLIAARLIRPFMVRVFPDVPADHPAMGAMIMNLAANALGLGNAATPFGIKAMQELDKLNPHKGTATNAMALFLAINTSSVTLLATGTVVMRRELGSLDAAGIIGTTLFATCFSTAAGILGCKLLERFSPRPPTTNDLAPSEQEVSEAPYPLWVSILALTTLVFVFIPLSILYGDRLSTWLVPTLVFGFTAFGMARGVRVYETFIDGAKEGFHVAVRIIPYLVAILVSVAMLTSSGALEAFTALVGPFTARVGLPAEALPMALIRPLSGSGATGVMMATMQNPTTGPDTYVGYLVSTLAGSSETTFYVLAVYFGAVQVQRMRHTLAAGLIADAFGIIGSIVAVSLYLR